MNSSSFSRQTVCQQDVSSAARSKRLQKQLEKELQEAGEGSRTRVPPRLRTTLPTASRVKVPGHIQTFVKVVLLVLKQNNPQPCHTCQFVALWHICILSQRMWPPVDAALDHQHPAVAAERTTWRRPAGQHPLEITLSHFNHLPKQKTKLPALPQNGDTCKKAAKQLWQSWPTNSTHVTWNGTAPGVLQPNPAFSPSKGLQRKHGRGFALKTV